MSYLLQIPQAFREGYAKNAAPESISASIRRVNAARAEAEDEYVWLIQLYEDRMAQIENGEWPVEGGE